MVRITDILCPIDFSEVSRHAFDRAVGVARCYDAVIHVLHVLPMSAAVHAVPVGPEEPGAFRLLDADRIRETCLASWRSRNQSAFRSTITSSTRRSPTRRSFFRPKGSPRISSSWELTAGRDSSGSCWGR